MMGDNGATCRFAGGVLGLLLGAAACAVPVPPTGGPADTTPPQLVASEPASGSVRFAGDHVRLEFDEYVDERSVASALHLTPTPVRPPEIRYGGRSVEVRFREPLRDSTTYIITLDTGFRDAHGAALRTPIQFAFSTGDVIDSGKLSGLVVDAESGRPSAAVDVFAYSVEADMPPDSLPGEPAYRTQTDGEGRFSLEHLASRPFLVVAVRDANRNRRIDADEAVAVPPAASVTADSAGTGPDRPWVLARRDTSPPELRRTAARSSSRIELLFSEGVVLTGTGRFSVRDSSGVRSAAIRLADSRPGDPRSLILRIEATPQGWWTVRGDSAVADSAGNVLARLEGTFLASSSPDTARARFRGFEGDTLGGAAPGVRELAPWAEAGLLLSDVLDPDTLRRSVAVADTAGNEIGFGVTMNGGASFRLAPEGAVFDVSVRPALSDSLVKARYAVASEDHLGELSGVVTGGAAVVVELHPASLRSEPVRRVRVDETGRFLFERLPGGRRYRIRAFVDDDADATWSPGNPAPWTAPESVTWLDAVPAVRARWETALPDTIRIGSPTNDVAPGRE